MKKLIIASAALALTFISCRDKSADSEHHESTNMESAAMTEPSKTTDSAAATPAPEMDSAAAAKAYENWMKPGPMHQWMASQKGKWEGEIRFSEGPGKPLGAPSKMKANFDMILNGLYQESNYKGELMGMPFEGKGYLAYDNARKKFINCWIDNMGSGVLYLEGDYDEQSRSLTLTGKSTEPMSGGQAPFKQVIQSEGDNKMSLKMYGENGGQDFQMIDIQLTKK